MPDESNPYRDKGLELIVRLDKYKNLITGNFSRVKKATLLWSSISLLYILGNIHINITTINETVANGNGIVTPWGVPIIGITEQKFFVFLLILTLYFSVKFWFSFARIMIDANPFPLISEIYSYQENKKSRLSRSSDDYEKFEKDRQLYDLEKGCDTQEFIDKDRLNDLLKFMVRRPTFGFMETVFGPIIFPGVLSLWAVTYLVIKICC